ncbi:MAG: hypothetical protein LBR53_05350 [Deltaproteobacteria bacterium]|jgi:hypothetical protein|nr:hypothetical protein [Deltaproteobacteria bacterium]
MIDNNNDNDNENYNDNLIHINRSLLSPDEQYLLLESALEINVPFYIEKAILDKQFFILDLNINYNSKSTFTCSCSETKL